MAKRLKVFRTTAGFYEVVVAAPNQGEALAAWGVRQNLFADGSAVVETDPQVLEAAMAAPGSVLRRPVGSSGPFKLDPDSSTPPKGSKAPAKPKADRTVLDAAELEMDALAGREREERDALEKRRAAFDAEEAAARARWDAEREAAQHAVDKARRAYDKARGR